MKNHRAIRKPLALLVLVTAVVAGCASTSSSSTSASSSPSPAASPEVSASPQASRAPAGPVFAGTQYPSQGHTHLLPGEPDDFVYNSDPPTSGPHRELFSDVFVSTTSLPTYVQVHLLEHGNVLLQYSCVCPDVAAALAKIAMKHDQPFVPAGRQLAVADVQNAEDQGKAVIVAPYPHMKSRIALTGWTRLGVLSNVDEQKIESFIDLHLGNPSESP